MNKLLFTLRDWNREYGKLQTEENTLQYYAIVQRRKIPKKILNEKLISLESWGHYAFDCNVEFRKRIQDKELNPDKEFKRFEELSEKEGRELYITALIGDNKQPYACIRFSGMFVVIEYIDEYNRVYMQYRFRTEYGKHDLFLYELEYFIYPENAKYFGVDNRDYVSYYFTLEGKLTLTKEYNIGTAEHAIEEYEADGLVNVEKNWEPYPKFGQWESIVKMERWEIGELARFFDNKE